MSDVKIPEDLQGWYEVLNQHRQNSARCSCNEVCKLIERIAALEAENARLLARVANHEHELQERDALKVNLLTANKMINYVCKERDALRAQVERLTALSYEDACSLSQEFNRNANGIPGTYRLVQETRINEWLKELIATRATKEQK